MPSSKRTRDAAGIAQRILVLRGQRVLLDTDLAALYGVSPKRLNEQVKRNKARFPEDFAFHGIPGLSREMVDRLSQIRPSTLGHASRIPGVTPAAVALVASHLDKRRGLRTLDSL